VWTAWPYASRGATPFPCGSVAVVPATATYAPTRTAREYPTIDSQRAQRLAVFQKLFRLEIFEQALERAKERFTPDATFLRSMESRNRSAVEKASPRHDAFPDFTSGDETFGRRGGVVRSGCSRKFESSSAADSATVVASSHVPSCRQLRSSKTFRA